MKRKNYLWRGTFNYSHEIEIKYTYAPTWASAKTRILRRIATDHGVNFSHVFNMFNGDKNNFTIEREDKNE